MTKVELKCYSKLKKNQGNVNTKSLELWLLYFSLPLSVYAIPHYLYSKFVTYMWILFGILTRLFQIACKLQYSSSQSGKMEIVCIASSVHYYWTSNQIVIFIFIQFWYFHCLIFLGFFTTHAYQLLSSLLPPSLFLDILSPACHLIEIFMGNK